MTDDIIINPIRLKHEPEIPANGIFYINPVETKYAFKMAAKKGGQVVNLFNSQLVVVDRENFFVAGPSVGAPMAVMTLEKLIALGGRRIIIYSWCGALSNSLEVEDVFMPTRGIPGEGTSNHYPVDALPESSIDLRQKTVSFLSENKFIPKQGIIWTTDAPYRESRQKVEQLNKDGVLAVDMEFTALSTVSRFRGCQTAAVMLVSDELWRNKWSPGFNRRSFKTKSRAVSECLMEYCRSANP